MEFKIALPNPRMMEPQMFFNQMRIVLKAAEKSYEQMIKDLDDNNKDDIIIHYLLPDLDQKELDKLDPDGELTQSIELEILV
jgi:hypothetical protein